MVNRMRATRSHRDNRRSHHALAEGAITKCIDCGASRMRHTVCLACGKYKGKQVIAQAAPKKAKKEAAPKK